MCEFWDKWFPAFFLGSFERFSSINLKFYLSTYPYFLRSCDPGIFPSLFSSSYGICTGLIPPGRMQFLFWARFGFRFGFWIVISQIFISWFVKLIDSVEISSCRDKIFIFFSHNVLNSPQSALFSFHLNLLDVPVALYLTPNDIRIGRCSLPHDWFIGFQVVWVCK